MKSHLSPCLFVLPTEKFLKNLIANLRLANQLFIVKEVVERERILKRNGCGELVLAAPALNDQQSPSDRLEGSRDGDGSIQEQPCIVRLAYPSMRTLLHAMKSGRSEARPCDREKHTVDGLRCDGFCHAMMIAAHSRMTQSDPAATSPSATGCIATPASWCVTPRWPSPYAERRTPNAERRMKRAHPRGPARARAGGATFSPVTTS